MMKTFKTLTAMAICLALAGAALGAQVRDFTATISPTEVVAGAGTSFTMVITNDEDSDQDLGSATVLVPAGFTVDSVTVPITGYPAGKQWQANLVGTMIELRPAGPSEGIKKLSAGESVTVVFFAVAPTPTEDTQYTWLTSAWQSTAWEGDANFTISSQPTVMVRVPTVIAAVIDIDPDSLNLDSEGQVVTCYIMLPEEYDLADIEIESILLNNEIEVAIKNEQFWCGLQDSDEDGVIDRLMVKFVRVVVQELIDEILEVGDEVELTVTGTVGGIPFVGSDTISINDK